MQVLIWKWRGSYQYMYNFLSLKDLAWLYRHYTGCMAQLTKFPRDLEVIKISIYVYFTSLEFLLFPFAAICYHK